MCPKDLSKLSNSIFVVQTLILNVTTSIYNAKIILKLLAPIFKNRFFLKPHFSKTESHINSNNIKIELNVIIPFFSYRGNLRSLYKQVQKNLQPLSLLSENKYGEASNTPKKKHRICLLTYNTSSLFYKNLTITVFRE